MTAYTDLDDSLKHTVDRIILFSGVPSLGLPPKQADLPGYIAMHMRGSIPAYVRHLLLTTTRINTSEWIVTIAHNRCFVELPKYRLTVKVDERSLVKLVKQYIDANEAKAEPEQLALFG